MGTHVFGLTGGIGSGKSSVAARFRERGLPVVDADQLAREAVAKGSPGLARIVDAFGNRVLDADGNLDRKGMAEIVFADPEARRALEGITHPAVRELSVQRMAELSERGEPLACYEVPLLVESGLTEALRPLVVVTAPEATQVERAAARDDATEEQVRARIRAQLPLADKVKLADHVIDNSGTREATRQQADRVLDAICSELGIDPARYPKG